MTNESSIPLRGIWFAYIALVAVLAAAIAAVVTVALHAPALVVLSWAVGALVGAIGLGFSIFHFFHAP